MKRKKCPYCSNRVGYVSLFSSRRKGEYVCKECGKESKVIIDKKIFVGFAVAAIISVAIMVCWFLLGLISNPLGIVLVAVPLVIFAAFSPASVCYEPLKKYKKSMEAKKAGIEYSDNLTAGEVDSTEWTGSASIEDTSSFTLNSELFNSIREKKNAERVKSRTTVFEPVSGDVEHPQEESSEQGFVPVINDVSENHSSSSDVPLRRIHHEVRSAPSRARHYISTEERNDDSTDEVKSYSGNRRF